MFKSRTCKIIVLGVLTTLVVALAGLATPGTSSAYSRFAGDSWGTPGNVSVALTDAAGGPYKFMQPNWLTPTRSPAVAGPQLITVTYSVERSWGTPWYVFQNETDSATVYAGQSITWSDYRNFVFTEAGYYRSTWEIWWRYPGSGQTFGYRKVILNTSADYRCVFNVAGCSVGPGYVYLPAY